MGYETHEYTQNMNFFKENVFSNKPINRTKSNFTKPVSLVWFHFRKTIKTKPNRSDVDFIGLDIFLLKIDPN